MWDYVCVCYVCIPYMDGRFRLQPRCWKEPGRNLLLLTHVAHLVGLPQGHTKPNPQSERSGEVPPDGRTRNGQRVSAEKGS